MVNKMEVVKYLRTIYGPKTTEREQKSIKGKIINSLHFQHVLTIFIIQENVLDKNCDYQIFCVLDNTNINEVIEILTEMVEEEPSNGTLIAANHTTNIQSTINNYCNEKSKTENDLYHYNLFKL